MKNHIFILHIIISFYAKGQCTFEKFEPYFPSRRNDMIILSDGGYLQYCDAELDTINFRLKETRMVLVKSDSCGKTMWVNSEGYQGNGDPQLYAIEMDSSNLMLIGYTAAGETTRIGKYSKNGLLIKEKLLTINIDGFIYGIVKNSKPNSYFLYGSAYYSMTKTSKPLIVEIDENLNIVKRREFQYNEISEIDLSSLNTGVLSHLKLVSPNKYYSVIGIGNNRKGRLYLAELDTSLTITKIKTPHIDSIYIDTFYSFGLYNMILSKDQKHLDCSGTLQRTDHSFNEEYFMRMDFDGNIEKIVYLHDSLYDITDMSSTSDGGFVVISGPEIIKLDSNLNTEWMKYTGKQLNSIKQLADGGYVSSGLSDEHTLSLGYPAWFDEMYLVKMDKMGNHIRTGENEVNIATLNELTIYPNPANSTLTIQSSQQVAQIQLWNTTGSLIYSENTHVKTSTIDVTGFANGLYFMKVIDANGIVLKTKKVSVIH